MDYLRSHLDVLLWSIITWAVILGISGYLVVTEVAPRVEERITTIVERETVRIVETVVRPALPTGAICTPSAPDRPTTCVFLYDEGGGP